MRERERKGEKEGESERMIREIRIVKRKERRNVYSIY